MIKKYWNDALLVAAAILHVINPIDERIFAAILGALALYSIITKAQQE